ncbi:FAD-dependent oxidoreductase [Roseomonas hellenica]|uniref:FAD-dependent oxidoreductase n=1 Tax=Plastoroseomonas hellenica TaxID=2687306 RepID=A0ABS5EUI5_9PROT|nr:FAD-dependent oxidoreductase [Plastoroseomonas hellenica]
MDSIAHGRDGIAIGWKNPDGSTEMLAADAVVVCAGVASRRFAAMLGDRINIYPVKGYSITAHLDDERSRAAAPTQHLESISVQDRRTPAG